MKLCHQCSRYKSFDSFSVKKSCKNNLRSICKQCDNVSRNNRRTSAQSLYQRQKRLSRFNFCITDFTKKDKEYCLQYFQGKCVYCGIQFTEKNKPTLDHIIPVAKQQIVKHTRENILFCCRSCNSSKHTKELITWLFEKFPDSYLNTLYSLNLYKLSIERF